MDYNFSQIDIAGIDIKELNRAIKAEKLTNEASKSVKDMRRKMKMRAYGVKNRQRKREEYQALEMERTSLEKELGELLLEVDELKEQKNSYIYQHYGRYDDDEIVDICF
ncbi:hypothetical protein LOD99_4849 [Oopsacas minuta]|uniref:Basic leucine zipper domain-containing protein n=1 Tax=Oopsacas minuta TaxID=111878 RepID=A0AAV7JRI1_9METZ|nr:hypothetical protein LOD99_4849 [Oopsacas minuta]